MKQLRHFALILLFLPLFALTQNCSRVSFQSIDHLLNEKSGSSQLSGNGVGYDGKLTFLHVEPGFKCEGKEAPKSVLRRNLSKVWTYTLNDTSKCALIDGQTVSDVFYIEGAPFVSYKGDDYYRELTASETSSSMSNDIGEFTVLGTADPNSSDANPGDGICANSAGLCSMIAAVEETNANPTVPRIIRINGGTYTMTKTMAFTSTSFVGIYGNVMAAFNQSGPNGYIISPNNDKATMTVQGLSFISGTSNQAFGASGVLVNSSVHIKGMIFLSHTNFSTPVIYAGAGAQHLLIEDTSIVSNSKHGVQIFNPESVTIRNSEIANNTGYGIYVDNWSENILISHSSISENFWGVKLSQCNRNCVIENSTISNNQNDGLTIFGTGMFMNEDIIVRNTTIASNGFGTGSVNNLVLAVDMTGGSPRSLRLENTILYHSLLPNCRFETGNIGYSLAPFKSMVNDSSCGSNPEFIIADPLLQPLAANNGGGPGHARSHLLSVGSPAIDAGNDALCMNVDINGKPRPVSKTMNSNKCDIGSVEQQ